MPRELRIRVGGYQRETAADKWSAPGMLRLSTIAGAEAPSPRPGNARPRGKPWRSLPSDRRPILRSLCPGFRGGPPGGRRHGAYPPPPPEQSGARRVISRDLPARRGRALPCQCGRSRLTRSTRRRSRWSLCRPVPPRVERCRAGWCLGPASRPYSAVAGLR
jgi:hypothetical protein